MRACSVETWYIVFGIGIILSRRVRYRESNGYDRISVDPEGAKRRECVSSIPGTVPSL